MLTYFYNIWHTVYGVNVQYSYYKLFIYPSRLRTVATLPWKTLDVARKVWQGEVTRGCKKLMPYLCQDAQDSFSLILALRLAIIIATSYWCSRCCHPFVSLLVTLPYSSKTVHHARQTVELLQCETPKFIAPDLWTPNSPDLNPVDYRI